MEKDFDGWNLSKKALHAREAKIYCHPREIWWCAFGVNIGFEQDGTGRNFDRPVAVIRCSFADKTYRQQTLTEENRSFKRGNF